MTALKEYQDRFYKRINLNKKELDVKDLHTWCEDNLGKKYLDWNIIDRGRQEPVLSLWIRDKERYLMYRLRWGDYHDSDNT